MNPNEKKHVFTQTSSEVPYNQTDVRLNEENKLSYGLAINFINKYHELMNNSLVEAYETSSREVEDMKFKFPEIPNYASLLPVYIRLLQPGKDNLEAKSETFNISSKNKTISTDTLASKKAMKLVKSFFNIVNIPSSTNSVSYSQTKQSLIRDKTYIVIKEKFQGKPVVPYVNVRPNTLKKVKNTNDVISKKGNNKRSVLSAETSNTNNTRSALCEARSDTNNIILYNEKYEKIYQNSEGKQTESREEKHEIANPFLLNSKDLKNVKVETLRAIGLYTDSGNIKPDIMNTLKKTIQRCQRETIQNKTRKRCLDSTKSKK